ncbi:tRNA-specific adenosine deaminase [Marinobacterium nitratireducens]|uniref:tRNA-specific adenosine deaminase n=1 Tax=Marinobacterium nitratireducens TaxID=518897 RepID=A0A917ZSD3_9GAMM|nr:tRNA adenosine(34) deaminase TadA [Marinobacterium nitratireducens]GGO88852.1 tRNA-specific adenosine deaminase [Marinobacterium nitratireducens]
MTIEQQLLQDRYWMREALSMADHAEAADEVPVGAIVVLDGRVIGRGWNHPISGQDPTAHAEIMALRDAAATVANYRLVGADLYVTIEPCTMCSGAIVHARIRRLVYGASEPKSGAVASNGQLLQQSWMNHRVEVTGGIEAERCSERISAFFRRRRAQQKALKRARDGG